MESIYVIILSAFALIAGLAVFVEARSVKALGSGRDASSNSLFKRFRNNYVLVYSLMMAGDWLQGPYVYALYEHYGYKRGDIGRLFIAGFGASMVFGTVVGSLADKHGRRNAAFTYVILYSLSCMTKHSPNYWVLMVGRLLGGTATSLLFSVFESWVVAEHHRAGFESSWLGDTFSKATFFGNGLMAVVAGLAANFLVDTMALGPVAPFDAAVAVMVIGGLIISSSWAENFGEQSYKGTLAGQFQDAWKAITSDKRVALLGAMQSLFEASMYTFVFLWTPALSPNGEKIPHGFIFACFMTSSMTGSAIAGILLNTNSRVEHFMKYVFGLSSVALILPCVFHTTEDNNAPKALPDQGITTEGIIQLVGFCIFEVLVGVFWPSMMTMRAKYVPEELRATIINCFRIPLNLFVCLILYNVDSFPLAVMFGLCSIFLIIAVFCQIQLDRIANQAPMRHGAHPQKEGLEEGLTDALLAGN